MIQSLYESMVTKMGCMTFDKRTDDH